MDNALNALFSWQFLLFSLGMFVITWVIRTIAEYFFNIDGNQLWEKLLLPLMPVTFGTVISIFATKYPYPDGLNSVSARILFGSVAGMFSGLLYQIIKGMLKDKIQNFVNNIGNTNLNTNVVVSQTTNQNETNSTIIVNSAKPPPPNPPLT